VCRNNGGAGKRGVQVEVGLRSGAISSVEIVRWLYAKPSKAMQAHLGMKSALIFCEEEPI